MDVKVLCRSSTQDDFARRGAQNRQVVIEKIPGIIRVLIHGFQAFFQNDDGIQGIVVEDMKVGQGIRDQSGDVGILEFMERAFKDLFQPKAFFVNR